MAIEGVFGEVALKIFEIFWGENAKTIQIPLYGVIYVVIFTIIGTFIFTRYWINRQNVMTKNIDNQKGNMSNNEVTKTSKSYKYISMICGRREVHEKLGQILRNSQKGDLIYASCNTCSYYPPQIYTELKNALLKGVTFYGMVRRTKDSEEFVQEILRYKQSFPNSIQLFGAKEELKIRMFGVMHKEVLLSFMYKDGFLGIYFQDATFTDLMYSLFDNTKKEPIES